jgi:hypothetical protein
MQLPPDAVAAARLPFGRAATLPADAYVDPTVHEAERNRIFRREWQFNRWWLDRMGAP